MNLQPSERATLCQLRGDPEPARTRLSRTQTFRLLIGTFVGVPSLLAACASDPGPSREESQATGGRAGDDTGAAPGDGDGGTNSLGGTGTQCSPAEVCVGASTGCTQCPSSMLCMIYIQNGTSVHLGGASGEDLTPLRHVCLEPPIHCGTGPCSCEESLYCKHGSCLDGTWYEGLGNLSEMNEGGLLCMEHDG